MLSTLDHVRRKNWPVFHGRPEPVFDIGDGWLRLLDHVCDQMIILLEPNDLAEVCITSVTERGGEMVICASVPAHCWQADLLLDAARDASAGLCTCCGDYAQIAGLCYRCVTKRKC
jgi:hypothetical protein